MTKGKVRGRRSNNEGTITKRADGRWEARITLPDGKRKSFYGKTQAEVRVKLDQAKVDKQLGNLPINEQQTIAQYLPMWVEIRRQQIDESSYLRYRTVVKRLVATFGKVRLVKLTSTQVQSWYAELLRSGLSTARVNFFHMVLKSALNDAVEMEYLVKNPLAKVHGPRVHTKKKMVLTEQQVQVLLNSLTDPQDYALYLMAVSTGMRRSEIAALQWHDVDLAQQVLHVRQGFQQSLKGYVLHDPKSSSSIRTIHLTDTLVQVLHEHQVRQLQQKERYGERWYGEHDFVFTKTDGRNLSSWYFEKRFTANMQQVGLPTPPLFTFHSFRHTFATLMLANGAPVKVVSEMLGHADIGITLSIYGHVIPRMQQHAVATMQQILDVKKSE